MKLIPAEPRLLAEEVVDVVVGDFGERRPGAGNLDLLHQPVENLVQLVGCLLHPQPDQAERGARVEDHHQDHAPADDADVEVVLLSFVKEDGEFLLADQLGESARGRDVAGGERGQRGGVEVLGGADGGDELAVLVDEEDDLGVGFPGQPLADPADLLELLVVHHHLRLHSRDLFLSWESISRRPCNARASVTWSAYSRSPPMGKPCAMRVTRTPSGFTRRVMYSAVASPSTVGSVATITSSTPWPRRDTSSFSLS